MTWADAQRIAHRMDDPDRLANVLVHLASLYQTIGRPEEAEEYAATVHTLPCLSGFRWEAEGIQGVIDLEEERYSMAIDHFQRALAGLGEDLREHATFFLWKIGEAHAGMGDERQPVQSYEAALSAFEQIRDNLYESSRIELAGRVTEVYDLLITMYADPTSELFDPARSLGWLERSKARTFVEALGFAAIPLHEAPASITRELTEEQVLLSRINQARTQLLFRGGAPADRLRAQHAIHDMLLKLEAVWTAIAPYCPEYVELRRGDIASFNDVQAALTAS